MRGGPQAAPFCVQDDAARTLSYAIVGDKHYQEYKKVLFEIRGKKRAVDPVSKAVIGLREKLERMTSDAQLNLIRKETNQPRLTWEHLRHLKEALWE